MSVLVEAHGLEKGYGSGAGRVVVLRNIDLAVAAGEQIALYGPSGSGKTTLLNLLGALDRADAGSLEICGEDLMAMHENEQTRFRREKIGFIFQGSALLPTCTALENIDLALRLPRLDRKTRRARAAAALEAVGLSAWRDHLPEEMSGGQRQRVSIARALALRPPLVLADEPTNGLDTRTARHILNLFRRVAEGDKTAFVIVTHDPMVMGYADSAYNLVDGQLAKRSGVLI